MARALMLMTVSLAALAGCLGNSYVGDEDSPFFLIPVGSRLTLHQELTIPAEQVAVFLQDGRALSSGEVRYSYPHCKFELYTLRGVARKVAPDDFTITKSLQQRTLSGGGPMLYGRLSASFVANGDMRDDGKSIQIFSTRMDLRSAKQSDVFRLTCSEWGYPGDRHVTIAEIRRALGAIMTLNVAQSSG